MGHPNLKLAKYSLGTGDRFAHQANAQLQACRQALSHGVEVIPVWNKSNREHAIIGSEPCSVRQAADAAVKKLDWELPFFCDADHITLQTVSRFFTSCDFFTIDVADFIGQPASTAEVNSFLKQHAELLGRIRLEGAEENFDVTQENLQQSAQKFLLAVRKAGEVYRKIESARGAGNFIPEISMDETDSAQSPVELLIILAAIGDEGIPIQTIAPKFSGRFNKGVDYQGDVAQFERELALDIAAIGYAVRQYSLPENLKLSIHSGSDKFSLYPAIHSTMKKFDAGVHLKTAGTTWLEELIGLAEAGGDGLALAKEIYSEALAHRDELCAPYANVIDIDSTNLPSADEVRRWSSEQYISALRHVRGAATYNSDLRQLLHVAFKVAAKMGRRYLDLLDTNEAVIAKNVTTNLYERHIAPIFLGRYE
jgi:tagaturonate epimerase